MLDTGIPITSLGLSADTVKESLAAAVNWRITLAEGPLKWAAGKAWDTVKNGSALTPAVPGAAKIAPLVDPLLTEEDGETIATVAGGFKPPHRGHMEMIQHYADMADRVKLFIGKSPRPIRGDKNGRTVTAEQSIAIWEKYLADAGLGDRVDLEIISGSPMKASYSVLENAEPGQTILMGCGEKDTYYSPEALAQYTPEGVKAHAAPCPTILDPNTRKAYSATAVRDTIKNNDLEGFAKFLPQASINSAQQIFSILGGTLQEMAAMAAGAVTGNAAHVPDVVGSEKRKPKEKEFGQEELVSEVMDYLLGITVG